MTTGYTQAELDRLQQIMEERAPALSTADDLKSAPHVLSTTWAGSYTGLMLNLQFQAGQSMLFHLNCVVAQELAIGIHEAATTFGWWEAEPQSAPDDLLPLFNTEQGGRALNAVSLTTGGAPDGVLANFSDGDTGTFRFFLPRSIARRVFVSIHAAGEAAQWWDKEFNLLPAQMPDDTVIKRAANQLMKQYGERAAMEAGLKANGALEAGDRFNHQLWQRVTNAVLEMQGTMPKTGDAIN